MSTDQTVDTAVDLGLEAAIEGSAPTHEELRGHQWLWIMRRALGLTRTRIGLGIVILMVLIAVFGRFVAPHSPTEFVAVPNRYGESGTSSELMEIMGLTPEGIVSAAQRVIARKR